MNVADEDISRLYTPRRFNALSKGRFIRDRRRRVYAILGGQPNDLQKIQAARLIGLEWLNLRLTAEAEDGTLSEHRYRVFMATQNHIRLLTRELLLGSPKAETTVARPRAARRKAAGGQEVHGPADAPPDPIDALVAALEAGKAQ